MAGSSRTQLRYSSFASAFRTRLRTNLARAPASLDKRELAQREWKRDLSTRPNGTIDPWYGCDLFDFVIDYALNYTYPWTNNTPLGFDVSGSCRFLHALDSDRICFCLQVYNIPSALDPPSFLEASFFLNGMSTPPIRSTVIQTTSLVDPVVKKAIHAPDQVWNQSVYYLFGGGPDDDPSE